MVERYRRQLFAFILNMTGQTGDADEVFQEVWFRAIRKIGSYRDKSFLSWLFRIARNLIIDKYRSRKRLVSLDSGGSDGGSSLGDMLETDSPTPLSDLASGELGERISAAVATLTTSPVGLGRGGDQKEVFLMRVTAEMPFKEIARIQKASINTVLARMHYALAKLRKVLREDYEELQEA